MIESIVIDYLNRVLDVPVSDEKPDEPIEKYVVVIKTGSSYENYIRSATLAIQSCAPSRFMAAELNEKVIMSMNQIIELDGIGRAKLNSDYDFTDTSKKEYRYQAVYDLTY